MLSEGTRDPSQLPPRESIELEDGTAIDELVNLTQTPGVPERFPDHPLQVGGFVLTAAGRLAYLRWVPSKRYVNRWDPHSQSLRFLVPERSQAFLRVPIDAAVREGFPVNVLLFLGNNRYDAGTFDLQDFDGSAVTLRRRSLCKAAVPVHACPAPGGDSLLETKDRALFCAWSFPHQLGSGLDLPHP